jgi:arginyl-tRNA synthetase
LIRDQLADALRTALDTLEVDPLPDEIQLERPARREHGDWSSNVALATAKKAGRNPRELAMALAEVLNASPPDHVLAVEVAGPGFVNFRLADSWLHDVLADVVDEGVDGYARLDSGVGTRVMVEFVSANPTGPLHAGHGRGAAYGDSLARVLERCGYDVARENDLDARPASPSRTVATTASTSSSGRPRSRRVRTCWNGVRPGPSRTIATRSGG